ncbi:MAG TPA: ABC transporter substrate-binding protein [Feifaniaceae bacterium]|nr:ABC transporter substrate-binding protein [Feifaniaceae bacterium]
MKRLVALMLLTVIVCLAFAGCAKEQEIRKVRLNEVTRSVFYAPQYVAAANGYFAEEGLEVEITTGGGSDKTMTALLSGQADIGLMGPETGVYVYNEGKEDHPVIVGQLTKRDGSFLVGRMDEPDFKWESLRGKTIIGGRKGGMPIMALLYVLKEHGLTPGTDVTVLDNIQFNLMGGAFEGGTGDYVTLFEPVASTFVLAGKGYIVANVGEASGEVPYTTYMVSQQMLKDDPAFVESFLRAIYKAQKWVMTATDEEVAKAIQPFFPDSSLEVLTSVAHNYRATDSWKDVPTMEEQDFERMLTIIDSAGELKARVPFADLVDNTLALEAMK